MADPVEPLVPEPGAHGGDAGAVAAALDRGGDELLDLSASLNPYAPLVADRAAAHLHELARYPDDRGPSARLAAAIGVDPERLVLTNGGAEAIALVAAELGVGSIVEPEFSLYRRHLASIEDSAGRWRSNPSNPLGRLAACDEDAVVWDEAFYPLATGRWSRGDATAWRLGSLTKLWACPGLRLGYVIAPGPSEATAVRSRRPQWSVNGLALALLPELLDATDLPTWAGAIADLRATFATELRRLGLTVVPSAANWVLIEDAPTLRSPLARAGIVVRDCTNFGLPGTVRIALPPPDELDRVLSAVAASSAR